MSQLALADLPRRIEATASVTAAMAQLSPFGLSEQWVLRDAGDRHWSLIADAMGQGQAVFTDDSGQPIYAAFCTTSLELGPARPQLGERIEISATLHAVSAARIGSSHVLRRDGQVVARLLMISTFVGRDESGSNRRIVRRAPLRAPDLPSAPEPLAALDARSRKVARALRYQMHKTFDGCVTPVPSLDFNAAGLLYFPTFSRLAETVRPANGSLRGREIVYMGNIDPGDGICLRQADGATLMTRTDGAPLALVRTTKG